VVIIFKLQQEQEADFLITNINQIPADQITKGFVDPSKSTDS